MRKILFIMAILLVASITGFSQDEQPTIEAYGTYTLFRADIDIFNNTSLQGWGAGVQWNPQRYFGVVAEFNGSYGSSNVRSVAVPGATTKVGTNVYTYLFGPRVSYRTKPVTLFAHSLFGFGTLNADVTTNCAVCASTTNNRFAMALGGGVDVNITKTIAIRAGDFDYVPINTPLPLNNGGSHYFRNFRYQTGVVFKF